MIWRLNQIPVRTARCKGRLKVQAIWSGLPEWLPLPAGRPVDLTPGGYHVMLMDLTRPLKEGDTVPITLTVVDKAGKTQKIEVSASVRAITATPPRTPAR